MFKKFSCILLAFLMLSSTCLLYGCIGGDPVIGSANSHDTAYPINETFFVNYPNNSNADRYYKVKTDDNGYVTNITLKPKFKGNDNYIFSGGSVTVTFYFKVIDNTPNAVTKIVPFSANTIQLGADGDGQSENVYGSLYYAECVFDHIEYSFSGTAHLSNTVSQ